jgi:hypothetical protein
MNIQALVDSMNETARLTRADYHLTLGGLISALGPVAPDARLSQSLGGAHSYRGYYSDLAFRPSGEITTAGALLNEARAALGQTFEGYKGGDFVMGPDTPLWVSDYDDNSGVAIMDIIEADGGVRIVTRQIE